MDYEAESPAADRKGCWEQWLANDSTEQPVARINYAETRLRELSYDHAPKPLPDEEAPTTRPGNDHDFPVSVPKGYPLTACTPMCTTTWDKCQDRCQLDNRPCLVACESDFGVCTQGCP